MLALEGGAGEQREDFPSELQSTAPSDDPPLQHNLKYPKHCQLFAAHTCCAVACSAFYGRNPGHNFKGNSRRWIDANKMMQMSFLLTIAPLSKNNFGVLAGVCCFFSRHTHTFALLLSLIDTSRSALPDREALKCYSLRAASHELRGVPPSCTTTSHRSRN